MIRVTKTILYSCSRYLNLIFTYQSALSVHNFKNNLQFTWPIHYLIPTHVNKLANTNRTIITLRDQRYTIFQ